MINKNYLEKVYAGFLGMNIGIRLGAPVEPTLWTYERIFDTYGEINEYVKDYINFAADDDANGPVYFLRALYDDARDRDLEPQDVANAWLNYAREGVGMFWWGGYGTSTEHTAYLNLKQGIKAPMSGSAVQNGKTLADQIGGQIFIDTWGLVNPDNVDRAVAYGKAAASVSHDGEGLYGAMFFCACISKAFHCNDIEEIIECGLSYIPQDSMYYKVSKAVIEFHKKDPDNFRNCMKMLHDDWGYDKFPGVCHIVPNAGVCILSMLYGQGDLGKTVEIATMCGWDTDCNAGNVGTVLGVMVGIDGIPKRYRTAIDDSIVLSGVSGYLNILDIPTYAKEVALLGYRLEKETPPTELVESFKEGEVYFDFNLKGSTHNIRLSDEFFCKKEHSDKVFKTGSGSLKILMDRMTRGETCKIFYKPFYTRADFSDERYMPVFSPTVYTGQKVSIRIMLELWNGWETPGVAPYVRTMGKKELVQGFVKLENEKWIDVEFEIPDTNGDLIDEVGVILEGYSISKAKTLGNMYIDEFRVYGKSKYTIDFKKMIKNFGTITPLATNHGAWSVEDGKLSLMRCEPSYAYTGNYFAKDFRFTTTIQPISGNTHFVNFRTEGIMRGYIAGFDKENKLSIYKNDFGLTLIKDCDFKWEHNKEYNFTVEVVGDKIKILVDGAEVLEVNDSRFAYGMYGCGGEDLGRTIFGNFEFTDL